MQLLDKLNELKTKFSGGRADAQDIVVIDAWIAKAKELLILKSLKDHDGIKYVLNIFSQEIAKINSTLLDNRELKEQDRLRLMDKRELCQKYLDLFDPIETHLEELEEKINENMSED
jgi:hypothetical protein